LKALGNNDDRPPSRSIPARDVALRSPCRDLPLENDRRFAYNHSIEQKPKRAYALKGIQRCR
jgi:hypothetical protein